MRLGGHGEGSARPARDCCGRPKGRANGLGVRVALSVGVFAACAASCCGDQFEAGGQRYPKGKVIGIENGEVRFRTEQSEIIAAGFPGVERIYIDPIGDFADFNAAEQFVAEGEPAKAIARYERQLRVADEFWPDLIRARLVRACDRAGQIDKAVTYFLRVMEGEFTGPRVAAAILPEQVPAESNALVKLAVDQIERSTARQASDERRAVLLLLKYDILRRSNDARAAAMTPVIAELAVPAEVSTPRSSRIQLDALREAVKGGSSSEALRWLDRGIATADASIVPDLLLLKGEAQLAAAGSREDLIRAGWSFMRVVVHFADDPRAAAALLKAAEVHQRLERRDKARSLLEECAKHRAADEAVRNEAQARLRALGG